MTAMSDSERRRFRITAVGQVFQDFELLESLSLVENILLPFRINGALKLDQTVRDRGSTLAKSVGLSEFLGRPVTKLSQGERQRVAICRAVIEVVNTKRAAVEIVDVDVVRRERIVRQIDESIIRRAE